MHIRHQQIIIADFRQPTSEARSSVQSYALAKDIIITNVEPCLLALELFIRRIFADRGKLKETIILSDTSVTSNHHM